MAKFNGKNWTIYNQHNTGLFLDRILCVTFDALGNKWIGTEYAGVVIYDNKNWCNFNEEMPHLADGLFPSIAIDAMDSKWIAGYGLTRYDSTSHQIYTPNNSGLPHNNTTAIAIDNMNNKWIGTEIGLAVFNEDGIVAV